MRAGDRILLQVWLRTGDAHYDITNSEWTITQLDGTGRWDLTRDLVDNLLEGNPHRDSLGNAAVWHFYDMAGTHRRDRMPAAEPLIAKFQASRARKPPDNRKAIEQAAQDFQSAVAAARPGSPLLQDLTGPRSPFWVRKRDDAKYLSGDAQAALAKVESDLHALRSRTPPLPCMSGQGAWVPPSQSRSELNTACSFFSSFVPAIEYITTKNAIRMVIMSAYDTIHSGAPSEAAASAGLGFLATKGIFD